MLYFGYAESPTINAIILVAGEMRCILRAGLQPPSFALPVATYLKPYQGLKLSSEILGRPLGFVLQPT
ncbi:hypothetical protein E5S67_06165 [Microcoleus sp. IPMA8]|uniref:Uncharacterized protein n=1 Tax=Microcoleus asticus IPMA8 TaxID=2563858 RepID=A0ABX2D6T6_9CYAN|nr:hypothetical protein [Microcoleus asticus IPMA8]